MQENEFEKQVRQKMESFMLLPNDDVWQRVAATIRKDKRRRPLALWILAFLLTGASGVWLYIHDKNERHASLTSTIKKSTNTASKPHATEHTEATNYKKEISSIKHEQTNTTETVHQSTSKEKPLVYNARRRTTANVKGNTSPATKLYGSTTTQQKKQGTIQETKIAVNRLTVAQPKQLQSDVPLHKYYKTVKNLQDDSIQALATISNKPLTADTSHPVTKVAQHNSSGKRWMFGVALYGGISNNSKGINLVSAKSLDLAYSSANLNQNAGLNNPSTPATQLVYKSNASFGAGAFVKNQLSKHTTIMLGVDYHYFSASTLVGSKVNSSRTVYDSTMLRQATFNSYYGAGQATTYLNKYHLLQLPADFGFALNKNLNKPFVLSIGLSPSLLMGSNAMYLNSSSNIYYNDNHQFNKFLLFGQTALMFTAINKNNFSISAGPTLQYNFNSLSKQQTHTNQHLTFAGVKTNIIIK